MKNCQSASNDRYRQALITANFTHIEKLRDLLDHTPTIRGYDEGETFVHRRGEIVFSRVSFGYESSEDDDNESGESGEPTAPSSILSDFDLRIAGGVRTAIV